MPRDFPWWVYPKKMHLIHKHYPNLSKDQINKECELFYDTFVLGGLIKPMSADYNRYRRGWLKRADLTEAENARKENKPYY